MVGVEQWREIRRLHFVKHGYLREPRPLFVPRQSCQRTVYRPAELCPFDPWEPSREVLVGNGQTRRGYAVVACVPNSRAGVAPT